MLLFKVFKLLLCVSVCGVCAKESVAKKSPSAQMCPVQSLVQTQVNPIGFSTQVAPLTHGDDKQACSTDENGYGEDRGDAHVAM